MIYFMLMLSWIHLRCTLIAGILMTHWTADSLTLWTSPLTDAHLWTAAAYYSLLSKMNVYMAAGTVAIVTVGFMGLVLSFQDGQVGNLMFDGASICEWRMVQEEPSTLEVMIYINTDL